MSTNHTENYSLCQWEPSDKVLRVDFNEDNLKIDTALEALEVRLSRLEGAAYTTERPQVAAGAFEGDGSSSRLIQTGFRPKAVMVMPHNFQMFSSTSDGYYYYGGYFADELQMTNYTPPVAIDETGFRVYNTASGKDHLMTNASGRKYFYIAVG